MRVLFSWIGFRDLNYIGSKLKDAEFNAELEKEKSSRPTVSQQSPYSPIVQVLKYFLDKSSPGERIDRLVLFFDLKNKILKKGIKKHFSQYQVEIIDVDSRDVHDYGKTWGSVCGKWHELCGRLERDIEPFFHLSSGTQVMNALLLVLGKISYPVEARFIQVSQNAPYEVTAPFPVDFNLNSYVVDEALRGCEDVQLGSLVGKSPLFVKAMQRAKKAAQTDCNVLIYGESGVGKELFAREIHKLSSRKDRKFLAINCATLDDNLAASELFGHSKGAYTGAAKEELGIFKDLDGGTLFLDEIEACPVAVQEKLLRALQPPPGKAMTCREFERLGDKKVIQSDVRIIAATNRPLDTGDFRNDLLNRLSTLCITIPPLRERGGDLRLLAQRLFEEIKTKLNGVGDNKVLCESAIKFIETRAWEGNVRQLQNALTQAIVFSDNAEITEDDFTDLHLPARDTTRAVTHDDSPLIDLSQPVDLKEILEERKIQLQKKYITIALEQTGGNASAAAKLLGITYQTIGNWKEAWAKLESK